MRIAARANDGRRSDRSASAEMRPRASGTLASTARYTSAMIMTSRSSAGTSKGTLQQMSNYSTQRCGCPTTPTGKALKGGAELTRRSIQMKARMYRLALVAGVVAVFLEGLGAGLKWG